MTHHQAGKRLRRVRRLLHRLRCPYCRYHAYGGAAGWNALTQDQRSDLVGRRTCDD